MTPRVAKIVRVATLAAACGLGLVARAANLHFPPLSVDEAESAINALTILEHGYPTDAYLGQPIYENTLVRPWPGNTEYEFRDVSYSDRGAAIYHGWLPLYAIAGSLAVAGVGPDVAADPPRPQHDVTEMMRRTAAARAPAVAFAGLLMVAAFLAGRAMAGADAGAAAAVVAALVEPAVRVGRQARYYSATLALATVCCWAVWSAATRGRRRDYAAVAVALGLTFHTHLVTFMTAVAIWALTLPWALRRTPGAWRRAAAALAGVAVMTVPWAIATGFPGPATAIPPARTLMAFPADLVAYLKDHPELAALPAAALLVPLAARALRGRLPAGVTAPWRAATMPLAMLAAWVVLGVAIFWVVTPASSAWLWRYTLPVQGPAAVLVGVLAAVAARAVAPRWAAVAPAVLLAAFLVRPKSLFTDLATPPPYEQQPLVQAIEHLRTLDLEPGARVYAVPTQHLPLTFYTGMAVQSIAPVRRSFLETYPHEIVLLDPVPRRVRVTPAAVSAGAREAGVSVSDADARRAAAVATHRSALNAVAGNVARAVDGDPAAEPLPPYATNLLRRPPLPSPAAEGSGRWQNPAIFRGHEAHEMTDFWPTYFYRFVDPAARTGANANYAGRLRNATATLLSNGWLAYRSPGAVAERAEGGKAEPPGNEGRP